MNNESFLNEIEGLKVFDAHTHLVGSKLCAGDFWEIVHYFWFLRELQGAGYPENYADLAEDERIDAFLSSFKKTKGTGMHYAVRRIFKDLYDLEITDRGSVYTGLEKVKASFDKEGWAKETVAKGNINYTVVNNKEHKSFTGLDGVSVWFPRIDGELHGAARRIFHTELSKRSDAAEKEKTGILMHLGENHKNGANALMTTLNSIGKRTWQNSGGTLETFDDCMIFLLHAICGFAEEKRINIQFFLGMERRHYSDAAPVDNNERILNLYGLFEKYKVNFDLVIASEGNNMDVVQAAHIFRNVYVGGMWWFNFRPSTYMDAMAKRFEVLASTKTYLSISDSRNIEWCYGKNVLIKKLVGDFLSRKVEEDYINHEDALEIAGDWLFTAAENLYGNMQNCEVIGAFGSD